MSPADGLVSNENGAFGGAEVFAAVGTDYAVYLPNASGSPTIDLSDVAGNVTRRWYNPDNGEFEGDETILVGGGVIQIGSPPSRTDQDWVVLLQAADLQVDSDGDGVEDGSDNCLNTANVNQQDSDADGFGNACDGDFNNDCIVNFIDVLEFSDNFLSDNLLYDINTDGAINFIDLSLISELFLSPPGPSQVSTNCQ